MKVGGGGNVGRGNVGVKNGKVGVPGTIIGVIVAT
jgi:hypothetical protein